MDYRVCAQRVVKSGEWESSRQVPTFIVDADSPEDAFRKAESIINPQLQESDQLIDTHISAEAVERIRPTHRNTPHH